MISLLRSKQLYRATNLEVVFVVDLNRTGSARVLARRHVPPWSEIPAGERRPCGRPVEPEIGEPRDQIVPVQGSAEVLVHDPGHRSVEIVPPIAKH